MTCGGTGYAPTNTAKLATLCQITLARGKVGFATSKLVLVLAFFLVVVIVNVFSLGWYEDHSGYYSNRCLVGFVVMQNERIFYVAIMVSR
jgi:hypothetical protein